ncbi:TetR family transcriptional regulator [Limnobaculum zhutongyuii]|uniref:TetR family transcriptional regulator n=1 Tax=Limnobaculum zhutongyuii TaxID=2498113 RepID=A0A411WMS8_9GAMM|nr:TetR family transcriptional regulator [Limnobaculum zhutongyuii]QBH97569.1 TetR family transcriptional regulator [Limnobaculum zhutongyuii]TQS91044.1 TetR family transcriptional regulator [Limnobaculum zhutongyuii]
MARKTKIEALITRQNILNAALEIFSSKGFTSTSLSDISTLAKVTRGAIYWHFENKDDILHEIFCDFEMMKSEHIKPFHIMLNTNPFIALKEALIKTLDIIYHDKKQAMIMSLIFFDRELAYRNDAIKNIRKNILFNDGDIESALIKCKESGVYQENFDIQKNATMIRIFVIGIIEYWLAEPDKFNLSKDGEKAVLRFLETAPII